MCIAYTHIYIYIYSYAIYIIFVHSLHVQHAAHVHAGEQVAAIPVVCNIFELLQVFWQFVHAHAEG